MTFTQEQKDHFLPLLAEPSNRIRWIEWLSVFEEKVRALRDAGAPSGYSRHIEFESRTLVTELMALAGDPMLPSAYAPKMEKAVEIAEGIFARSLHDAYRACEVQTGCLHEYLNQVFAETGMDIAILGPQLIPSVYGESGDKP